MAFARFGIRAIASIRYLLKEMRKGYAKDVRPVALVQERFRRIDADHVEYVLDCMLRNTTKIRNIKSYLLTALYNAPSTISSYYRAEANHDLAKVAG